VKHHREIHMPLVKHLLGHGMRRYVAHYVDEAVAHMTLGWTQVPPPYDIIVEIWYEDETWENLEAFFATPEGRRIPEDEKHWLDQESLITMVTEQYQII